MKIYKQNPVIRQAGSIICQNFGEPVHGHGYTIWDLNSRSHKHFEIKNEMAHVTLNIRDGKIINDITNLPKTPRIRIYYENTTPTSLKECIVEIRKVCNPIEIIPFKSQNTNIDNPKTNGSKLTKSSIKDLSDIEYQNTLLKEFFKDDPNVSDEILSSILEINKKINGKLVNYTATQEVNWVPHKLTFSNTFSYGEDNVVDFDKMNGIIGIFGKNKAGKSSIGYLVSFCLFDKCPTTSKAENILNSRKDSMCSRLDFSVGDNKYYIEKTSTKDKKGNVPVKIEFKKDSGDGINYRDLKGETRAQTTDIIRKYVGTYDDFMLTTLSIQGPKSQNLIEMGQADRKSLLSRFTGLDIYERLNKLANEEAKEILVKLKLFKRDEYEKELVELQGELKIRVAKQSELDVRAQEIDSSIDSITSEIEIESKNIKSINIESDDANTLQSKLELLQKDKISIESKIKDLKSSLAPIEKHKCELELKIKNLDIEKIKSDKIENDAVKTELINIEKKLTNIKTVVKIKIEKVKHLESHKYDPNCKFCIDNDFVRDAMKAKEELESDKVSAKALLQSEAELKVKINNDVDVQYSTYLKLKEEYTTTMSKLNSINSDISRLSPEKNDVQIEKLKNSIQNIKNNEDIINWNRKIESVITSLKSKRNQIQLSDKKDVIREINENSSRKSVILSKIEEIEKKIIAAKQIEISAMSYQSYIKATGKDGIPLNLLSSILPTVEEETNDILSKITDFTLSIAVDDGDIVIKMNGDGSSWPIEMGSGMEKFISSVAVRVALINVSRIPKPSFITIDEGFGTLDDENLSALPSLFAYLKEEFKFVMIVSHLDTIKDYVDDTVDITKDLGFSHVEYK